RATASRPTAKDRHSFMSVVALRVWLEYLPLWHVVPKGAADCQAATGMVCVPGVLGEDQVGLADAVLDAPEAAVAMGPESLAEGLGQLVAGLDLRVGAPASG